MASAIDCGLYPGRRISSVSLLSISGLTSFGTRKGIPGLFLGILSIISRAILSNCPCLVIILLSKDIILLDLMWLGILLDLPLACCGDISPRRSNLLRIISALSLGSRYIVNALGNAFFSLLTPGREDSVIK